MVYKLRLVLGLGAIALVLSASPTLADPTGDPIDHLFPLFHGPPHPGGDTFHTGPGVPLGFLEPDSCLVVDISTSTVVPGNYWVVYDFGLCPDTLVVIPPNPITIETHDIEWVGQSGIPQEIIWWGKGGALAAFGGPILALSTTHDLEPSGFGFDVGVAITDQSLLGSGDGYLIQFNDPHGGGGGALPPPPGYTQLIRFTVAVEERTWSAVKKLYD